MSVRTYLWMEEEAWSWPHVLVFQSLKRVAHSPLLNPANSRFLSALYASNIGICIFSITTKITIKCSCILCNSNLTCLCVM